MNIVGRLLFAIVALSVNCLAQVGPRYSKDLPLEGALPGEVVQGQMQQDIGQLPTFDDEIDDGRAPLLQDQGAGLIEGEEIVEDLQDDVPVGSMEAEQIMPDDEIAALEEETMIGAVAGETVEEVPVPDIPVAGVPDQIVQPEVVALEEDQLAEEIEEPMEQMPTFDEPELDEEDDELEEAMPIEDQPVFVPGAPDVVALKEPLEPTTDEPATEEEEVEEEEEITPTIPATKTLPPGWQENQKPGNYLKKDQIFKKAGDVYDQIRNVEPAILKAQKTFFEQKTKINDDIGQFFFDIGTNQNDLSDQIEDLLAEIEKEEDEMGELLEEDREIILELKQNKEDLKQLKENISSVGDLSGSLDDALAQLNTILGNVQDYEDQGWQLYQKIDEIFDDQQADVLLGQMNAIIKNAQALQSYIQGPFSKFFGETSTTIKQQIQQISSTIKALEDRGLALSKKEEEVDKKQKEAIEREKKAEEEKVAEVAETAQPWYVAIRDGIANIWSLLRNAMSTLYQQIFQRKADEGEGDKVVAEASPESVSNDQQGSVEPPSSLVSTTLPPVTLPPVAKVEEVPPLPIAQ